MASRIRRYARADELGIPYCVTFDYDSLKDKSVTLRNRDTTDQIRVKIKDLNKVLNDLIYNKKDFKKLGKLVK